MVWVVDNSGLYHLNDNQHDLHDLLKQEGFDMLSKNWNIILNFLKGVDLFCF